MATSDTLDSLSSSLLSGIFDATGAATQAGLQNAVYIGLFQFISGYNQYVRTGLGMLLSDGVNDILEKIGCNLQNIPYIGGILENIVQSGLTSAATVFQHVLDGSLTLDNLPGFGDYNVNSILSNALGINGSIAGGVNGLTDIATALANHDAGALGKLLGGNSNAASGSSIRSNTSYAAVMANLYPPKFKFLYIVTIQFKNEYKDINNSFTFLIKQFERPKITIEHDEVNFYSFRSMVPKRVVYQPFNIEIHDDIKSETMKFFVGYLRKISPLFNQKSADAYELNGMDYTNASSSYGLHTQNDNFNVIDNITVYHLYDYNAAMDVYRFHNPKILEATLGDLDMSAGTDGSSINLSLAYDGLDMNVGVKAKIPGQKLGLLDLMANKHPVNLGTADSNGAPINGKSLTNITYMGAPPPDQPGNLGPKTLNNTGELQSVNGFQDALAAAAVNSPAANSAWIDEATKQLTPVLPGNAIDEGLLNAQKSTLSTAADNILNDSSYLSSTSPKIMPSLSEIAGGATIPTSAPTSTSIANAKNFNDMLTSSLNYGA